MASDLEQTFYFQENDEVLAKLRLLEKEFLTRSLKNCEALILDLIKIFAKYKEKPFLLDSALPQIMDLVFQGISFHKEFNDIERKVVSLYLELIYALLKIRGIKEISIFFPKATSAFVPVLELLVYYSNQVMNSRNYVNSSFVTEFKVDLQCPWKAVYALFIWINGLLLLPFDLLYIESNQNIQGTLLKTCLQCMIDSSPIRELSAKVLGRYLSRKDILNTKSVEIVYFFKKCFIIFDQEFDFREKFNIFFEVQVKLTDYNLIFFKRSCLLTIAAFLKFAERQEKLQILVAISLKNILGFLNYLLNISTLSGERLLVCKIISRTANALLRARYEFKCISLSADIKDISCGYTDIIEQLTELLLFFLQDQNTAVRWSAAKGVSRIFERLQSRELKEELIENLILKDGSHGSILALAELTRKCLINDQLINTVLFQKILGFVSRTMFFEEHQANSVIGSNIRDAACFFVWSCARSNPTSILLKHEGFFIFNLISLTLFDSDMNCRRCGAATIQEYIGRLGHQVKNNDQNQISKRLLLIEKLNYFSVKNLRNCFLVLAKDIAELMGNELRLFLIDNLFTYKLKHRDHTIRTFSTQCLYLLENKSDMDRIIFNIELMLQQCLGTNVSNTEKIGALLYLSNAIKHNFLLPEKIRTDLRNLPIKLEKMRCYRGTRGDLIRTTLLNYIKNLVVMDYNKFKLSVNTINHLLRTIEVGLIIAVPSIQLEAQEALCHVIIWLQSARCVKKDENEVHRILDKWHSKLLEYANHDMNIAHRKGGVLGLFCYAVGSQYNQFLNLKHILSGFKAIFKCSLKANENYCFQHICANRSLISLIQYMHFQKSVNRYGVKYLVLIGAEDANSPDLRKVSVEQAFKICIKLFNTEEKRHAIRLILLLSVLTLQDYDTDERGDVGSWIRMATVEGLYILLSKPKIYLLAKIEHPDLLDIVIRNVIKQFLERNISISRQCVKVLEIVLPQFDQTLPSLNRKVFLESWKYIEEARYTSFVIYGLISSLSDFTASTRKEAEHAMRQGFLHCVLTGESVLTIMLDFLKENCTSEIKVFNGLHALTKIIRIVNVVELSEYLYTDTIEILLSFLKSKSFRVVTCLEKLAIELLNGKTRDSLSHKRLILNLLSHRFAKIRIIMANDLYIWILSKEWVFGNFNKVVKTTICNTLVSSDWGSSNSRNEVANIANALGIEKKNKQI